MTSRPLHPHDVSGDSPAWSMSVSADEMGVTKRVGKPPIMRVLTNSERSSFACRRRWAFRYLAGLTTGVDSAPLRTGSLWHQCLAAFYYSGMTLDAHTIVRDVIEPWAEQRAAWRTAQPPSDFFNPAEHEAEDTEIVMLTTGMLTGYMAAFAAVDRARFEVVAVEAPVARWLPNPDRPSGAPLLDRPEIGGKRTLRQWAYGGQVDLVLRDRTSGDAWFLEHKTTTATDLQQYARRLLWDPQTRGYAWAMRDPIEGSAIREPIRVMGCILNVARKKVPRVPELVKGKKKDDPPRLSLAAIDTTRDVYLAEIQRHGFNPDDYADMLEKLRSTVFFHREAQPFSEADLDEFAIDAACAAQDMIIEGRRAYHQRQTSVCTGVASFECQYATTLCLADGPMARKSFRVMNIRHPELPTPFAEDCAQERGLTLANDAGPSAPPPAPTTATTEECSVVDPFLACETTEEDGSDPFAQ